ncbi:MAG: hypothetical protein IIC69_03505 [Nanoarchaeota archaeon]|nr:hypothetical protein [Nanoarchaeota archaeon]
MSIEKAKKRIEKELNNSKNAIVSSIFIMCLSILKEESISPCENCQALETKIEQMKTDHALEQLDRNMAKDRNGN